VVHVCNLTNFRPYAALAKAAYRGDDTVGEYKLRSSSTLWNKVYDSDKEIALAISGTNVWDPRDLAADAVSAVSGSLPLRVSGLRWKESEEFASVLRQEAQRTGRRFVITGHSLGGYLASKLSPYADQVYTFNKHTPVLDLLSTTPSNEVDYSSHHDVLTVLNRFQRHSVPLQLTDNAKWFPMAAHSID